MILTLLGNDITRLTLGVVQDDQSVVVPAETIPCAPEDYLGIIDSFLRAHDLSVATLTGIQVASSNGSATAQRVSHAIANVLHFTHGIPLYHELGQVPVEILLPKYEQAAHVTARKKDALYRKT